MTEFSVEGRKLDALAQHFNNVGTDYLEPYLKLLDGSFEASRIPFYGSLIDTGEFTSPGEQPEKSSIEKVDDSDFDALREHNGFFTDLGKRDGTFVKTTPAEFGGGGAPWAAGLSDSWNSAVDARAYDLHGVIWQLYMLADTVIAAFESYEDTDVYNEQGIRQADD